MSACRCPCPGPASSFWWGVAASIVGSLAVVAAFKVAALKLPAGT